MGQLQDADGLLAHPLFRSFPGRLEASFELGNRLFGQHHLQWIRPAFLNHCIGFPPDQAKPAGREAVIASADKFRRRTIRIAVATFHRQDGKPVRSHFRSDPARLGQYGKIL